MQKNIKQKKFTFFAKYKWWIFGSLLSLVIVYIFIYYIFRGNGFLSAGLDLKKSDWLLFLGEYFAFGGTILVSSVATLQAKHYAEIEKNKSIVYRKKTIQPIFSIKIIDVDKQVNGTVEILNISDKNTYTKHKNISFCIENVGEKPILNVIIFDKYLYQMLKPGEEQYFQVAYSDSPDIQKWKTKLIEIFESSYERNPKGIPMWFNINYDDIDGNEMFQTFELKNFDETYYYSLEGIYEA